MLFYSPNSGGGKPEQGRCYILLPKELTNGNSPHPTEPQKTPSVGPIWRAYRHLEKKRKTLRLERLGKNRKTTRFIPTAFGRGAKKTDTLRCPFFPLLDSLS